MGELEEFLFKRGLDPQSVERLKEEKMDCQTLLAMTDEQLKKFIPKLGDVIATKKFCQSFAEKEQSESRKMILLKKLKHKPGQKRRKPMNHSSDSDEETDRSAKLMGNANARKGERKIEIGWCNYNETIERYQQIRKRNGGGTRELKCNLNWKAENILQCEKKLFFPDGISTKGKESEFSFSLQDFKQSSVPDDISIEEMYKKTHLKILRFYVFSKKLSSECGTPISDQSPQDALSDTSIHSEQFTIDADLSLRLTPEGKSSSVLAGRLSLPDDDDTDQSFFIRTTLPSLQQSKRRLHLPRKTATCTRPAPSIIDTSPKTLETQQPLSNANQPENTVVPSILETDPSMMDMSLKTLESQQSPVNRNLSENVVLPLPGIDTSVKSTQETSFGLSFESISVPVKVVVDDDIIFSLDTNAYVVMSSMNDQEYLFEDKHDLPNLPILESDMILNQEKLDNTAPLSTQENSTNVSNSTTPLSTQENSSSIHPTAKGSKHCSQRAPWDCKNKAVVEGKGVVPGHK